MPIKLNKSLMNKDCRLTEVKIKKNLKAEIYDNCLPLPIFFTMREIIMGMGFPWFYGNKIVEKGYDVPSPIKGYENNEKACQFAHGFLAEETYNWSNQTQHIVPILNVIKPRAWLRVKANLALQEEKSLVHGWHYDMVHGKKKKIPYQDSITGVLHFTTNNGYTLMETGQKVESIENRLVLFPNNILHTGMRQTDKPVRVLLNFNFFASL